MKNHADSVSESLPDLEICRTRLLEPVGLVECLVGSPEKCSYVLTFGGAFFCQHPDCLTFAKSPSTNP
jgi:hypothetical protein